MGDNDGNTRRPDPALGGLDEDLERARAIADDDDLPAEDRRVAAAYALALTSAVRVLTGQAVAVLGILAAVVPVSTVSGSDPPDVPTALVQPSRPADPGLP